MEIRVFIFRLIILFSQSQANVIYDKSIPFKLIEDVHTYFNNTCIIYLHPYNNPMQTLGVRDSQILMSLFRFTSRLHIRTNSYSVRRFRTKIGDGYYALKRPLFALINDSKSLQMDFQKYIASWIHLAYINWVVFLQPETSIDDYMQDIYIPLNCIFLVIQRDSGTNNVTLTEVYRIDRGEALKKNFFARWNEDEGLMVTSMALYQRRGDLEGHILRVTSVEDVPVSEIERDDKGRMVGIKGFFGILVQLLEKSMNFTAAYIESFTWGIQLPNKSWTGVVGMVDRREIDLAATELTMTSDRQKYIEFTTPVYTTKFRTYIQRPEFTAIKWTAFIDPFFFGIWNSILAVIVLAALIMYFAIKYSPDNEQDPRDLQDIVFLIYGANCGQGLPESKIDSVKTTHVVVHLTSVVLVSAYAAALISFLAIKVFVMPFSTMEGLLQDGSYKFGLIRESADLTFFQNTSDSMLQRMFHELLEDYEKLPRNYFDGLQRACSDDDYAFATIDNMFNILESRLSCILEPLDTIMQLTIAMAVQRRSPFRGIINNNILAMRDSGVLQRVFANELAIEVPRTKAKEGWTSVEIFDILPLTILIIGGIILATVFSILECFCHRFFKNKYLKNIIKSKGLC